MTIVDAICLIDAVKYLLFILQYKTLTFKNRHKKDRPMSK